MKVEKASFFKKHLNDSALLFASYNFQSPGTNNESSRGGWKRRSSSPCLHEGTRLQVPHKSLLSLRNMGIL